MFTHKPVSVPNLPATMTNKQRWYLTPDGQYYPSITTVLGAKEKPYLIEWRNSLGHQKADKEMERAAKRGTAVHEVAERYLNNQENPTRDHDKSTVKLFNQLKIYIDKIDNIYLQEKSLYSDVLQVAGRVDCIADFAGVPSIIDFKSSTNMKHSWMIEDYYLQETFYCLAFAERTRIEVPQIVTLVTVEKGLPLVFKKSIEPYIVPLTLRIDEFYQKFV